MTTSMPAWASELKEYYESGAANQFVLYGNIGDKMLLPGSGGRLGTITDFISQSLLAKFDIVLEYDVGGGVRIVRDNEVIKSWPAAPKFGDRKPQAVIPLLNHLFLYCHNLSVANNRRYHVAVMIKAADLVVPFIQGGFSQEINSIALQIKQWSTESEFTEQPLAVIMLTESINALHPQIQGNVRSVKIEVPFPTAGDIEEALTHLKEKCATALSSGFDAARLVGVKLSAIESLVLRKEHRKEAITSEDLRDIRKRLVEQEADGLIEFIHSKLTMDALVGEKKLVETLRLDMRLWEKGETDILPMGYLLAGPVGTGKTFYVSCLAGEANVPVVKLKNFRDKYVGESEAKLEKIFRLLHALGRCIVFIDEADQNLGKRDSNDESGVSGRLYSMMAEEMSKPTNRGRILWILASSRPDLIEIDFKRPGRIDVKVPLFPTTTSEESYALLKGISAKKGIVLSEEDEKLLLPLIPNLMTPGEINNIGVKVQRQLRLSDGKASAAGILKEIFDDYTPPISRELLQFQIELAIKEASDMDFVPAAFLKK